MTDKAVIFDMDGVLIDSERLWKQAEKEVFSSFGVVISEEDCKKTQSMTTSEVTKFWFSKSPWQNIPLKSVEQMVIKRVEYLITNENCEIINVKNCIENLKNRNYKIGLATNSPYSVLHSALTKMKASHLFDATSSAECEAHGKPDPSVYLTTAAKLNVAPENCIAIEDSLSGMVAAKKAGMTVIGFTNGNTNLTFDIADYIIHQFDTFDIARFTSDHLKPPSLKSE